MYQRRKMRMITKPPSKNNDLAKKKALETLLAETKTSVEDKVAALKPFMRLTDRKSAQLCLP